MGFACLRSESEQKKKKKMGSKWRKAKLALGLNLCVVVPRTLEDSPSVLEASERHSDVALLSPANSNTGSSRPTTPSPSSHGLWLSKSGSKSSKVPTCSLYIVVLRLYVCVSFGWILTIL